MLLLSGKNIAKRSMIIYEAAQRCNDFAPVDDRVFVLIKLMEILFMINAFV